MNHIIRMTMAAIFMVFAINVNASDLNDGDFFTLSVIHTNDVHGYLDNMPKYATIIKRAKSSVPNLITIDGGDVF